MHRKLGLNLLTLVVVLVAMGLPLFAADFSAPKEVASIFRQVSVGVSATVTSPAIPVDSVYQGVQWSVRPTTGTPDFTVSVMNSNILTLPFTVWPSVPGLDPTTSFKITSFDGGSTMRFSTARFVSMSATNGSTTTTYTLELNMFRVRQ